MPNIYFWVFLRLKQSYNGSFLGIAVFPSNGLYDIFNAAYEINPIFLNIIHLSLSYNETGAPSVKPPLFIDQCCLVYIGKHNCIVGVTWRTPKNAFASIQCFFSIHWEIHLFHAEYPASVYFISNSG